MTDPLSFSSNTPKLGLPMLFAGQSQKEATVNEALLALDLISGGVLGIRNDPPVSPSVGQTWIVGNAPTGAFFGQNNRVAGWTEGGWRFISPATGMRVHDLQVGATRLYDGTWRSAEAPAAVSGGAVIDDEARSAIAAVIQALKTAGIFSNS